MTSKTNKSLLSLSDLDKKYFAANNRFGAIEKERVEMGEELAQLRRRLEECETAHKDGRLRQVLEEHRLRDEEQKIVERRKQLTAMGGVKAAKLVEREIDIASRTLQKMEEQALKAMEQASESEKQIEDMRLTLDSFHKKYEDQLPQWAKEADELSKEVNDLKKERQKMIATLDERLARLYERVTTRYPGGAAAFAQNGSCRSCYRALPAQTYNQVRAGNMLMQCPGCSRILLYVES